MCAKSRKIEKLERRALPDTTDGICALIREVLSSGIGHVKKLELHVNDVVRVTREVDANDLDEVPEDWEFVLRNVEMLEYSSEGASPYQVLVDMMLLVQHRGLRCIAFCTGDDETGLIDTWLELKDRGMPTGVHELLNLPIHRMNTLPEETLVLCGSKYSNADPTEVELAVKTTIEVRDEKQGDQSSREVDDPVGDGSGGRGTPVGQLALASGGLRRVPWKSRSQS